MNAPLSPPRVLALGMGSVIAAGAVLLALPIASATGESLGFSSAFFTATSAVCVTGLIVADTPSAFSAFGHAVILVLIQVGGLGYMSLSTAVALALRGRLSIGAQAGLQESLNLGSRRDLARFMLAVFKLTLAFEMAGAALLALRWWSEFGPLRAAWFGLFHSVSAFNNAGFSLFPNSLMNWRGDLLVNLVVTALIISGGLGYLVLIEVGRYSRERRLSLHTRLVLVLTAALIGGGTVVLFYVEGANPGTLGDAPRAEALLAAFFQSVTARTAGFNTVDVGALRPASLFLLLILMFVGGAPGGTAGGVKVSTFGVTVMALWATVRGLREPVVLWRRLPAELVARAFFISLIGFLALNCVAGVLLLTEGLELLPTLFEATSAFGTVGLSTGIPGHPVSLTGGFSEPGRLLIAALMFAGRVGPLTLAVALAGRRFVPRVGYPEGRVLIG